jgi:hypothetical protein
MTLFGNLRGWSGALLAGFLTLALMTPTLDIFLCGGESALAATDQAFKTASADDASGQQQQQNHDTDSDCDHGHCHHGIWMGQMVNPSAFAVSLSSMDFSQALYSRPPSPPPMTLLRPPRA